MTREEKAWGEFRSGDEGALKFIFNIYYNPLFNYGHKFTFDDYLIEDVIQDTFVKLWEDRSKINETGSVKNYIYKTFRRRLIRKLDYAPQVMAFPAAQDKIDFNIELGHDHQMISNERAKRIQQNLADALEKMLPRQREIIHLRYFEEMDFDEIADVMQLSTKATYKMLYRAIDTLKKHLPRFDYLVIIYLLNLSRR
ncbi:RNA polymerase sigma factor [Pedobacter sp. MC2016-24]|uniref:RNA polymerase sigma factor n=1 Tax=Pedobacter sp. MC2016-24 TaxID=2780090 RepID=UPI001882DFB1|nr:sigma-70 family RNA polymerase sigma factor [Pedobacter sp. MC2016-24]MBE9601563.1 sigma-70 family RNA polymerase sigma factor [Pedobacter sp. MC2016-24]